MSIIEKTRVAGLPRLRLGPVTCIWRPRPLIVVIIAVIIAAALFVISVGSGDYPLGPGTVIDILFNHRGSDLERTIVFDWRLPRAIAAAAVGAALGISGAITQSVTRNALASPDILGITSGASAMAATIIILGGATGTAAAIGSPQRTHWLTLLTTVGIPIASFAGALCTAIVIWLLASLRKMDTFRLVLAGIVITALLQAYTTWLMLRADIHDAAIAKTWLTGSLASTTWHGDIPVVVVTLLMLPLVVAATASLKILVLGDDTATGLGVHTGRSQTWLLLIAVLLSAVAVAATGPIAFVAFVAPQVALRLAKTASPPLLGSAATGATLLIAADLTTRVILPVELPVGIVTSAVGGIFLIYLLIRVNRKTTAS